MYSCRPCCWCSRCVKWAQVCNHLSSCINLYIYRPQPQTLLRHRSAIVEVGMSQLELGAKLGDGASGDVFAATLHGVPVALKVPSCASLHIRLYDQAIRKQSCCSCRTSCVVSVFHKI